MVFWLLQISLGFSAVSRATSAYYAGTYPADHWAVRYPSPDDEHVVAIVRRDGLEYGVRLHPHDRRGYRALVTLIDRDMAGTLNRSFTWREKSGLQMTLGLVAHAYERLGLIAQILVLGNNAHSFDPSTCTVRLGSAEEPLLLHGHVIGRGDPAAVYAGGVSLGGPLPGEVFGVHDRSTLWGPGEAARVAADVRRALVRARDEIDDHISLLY